MKKRKGVCEAEGEWESVRERYIYIYIYGRGGGEQGRGEGSRGERPSRCKIVAIVYRGTERVLNA